MKKLVTYLGGFMEFSRGSGVRWRQKLAIDLKKIFGSNIIIQDPTKDEKKKTGMSTIDTKKKLNYWKKIGNVSAIKNMMHDVIKADMESVNRCNFIIIYWDKDIPTYGTIGEIQHAYDRSIPIYFICDDNLIDLSSWIIGEYTVRFDNFNDLIHFLQMKYSKFLK